MTIFRPLLHAAMLLPLLVALVVAQETLAPTQDSAEVAPAQYQAPATYPLNIFPPPAPQDFQGMSNQPVYERPPAHPPASKDGLLQQIAFQATYLPWFNRDTGQGDTDLEFSATVGVPFPTRDSPLLITPYFATHFLDGPINVDVPGTLYDATLEFRWLKQWNESFGTDLSATPGVHTDFQASDNNGFRTKSQLVGAYEVSPEYKWVLGVAYTGRNDVTWLPIGGLIWTPNDDVRYELVFPKPKLAHRIRWDGRVEDWWYIAGELAGDQWDIVQSTGFHNTLTTRDYRVILGIERKVAHGFSTHAELGYVFARRMEFDGSTPDFDPSSTLMVRLGTAW